VAFIKQLAQIGFQRSVVAEKRFTFPVCSVQSASYFGCFSKRTACTVT
jgi:hypothetical protein